jgi:hypothetical protein
MSNTDTQDRKPIREVIVPVAGVPLHIIFRHRDCHTLKTRLGEKWFLDAADRLNSFDMEWMEIYLQAGGKDAAGKTRPIKLEECGELSVAKLAELILHALYLSVHEKDFIEYQIWAMEALSRAQNPPNDPENSSTNSSELLSGSDSDRPSSTNSPQEGPSDTSKSAAKA